MMDSRTSNRAMISVIEKARGRSQAQTPARLLSVLLMAVFFVALMGSLAFGAVMYRTAVDAQLEAYDLHLQSGLLTNLVRYNDVAGALQEGEGPEGPALVLTRTLSSGTYETRIYQYQGQLLQEFTAAGQPYDPQGATKLLDSDTFSFEEHDGLVVITTDKGSFPVYLRSDAEALADAPAPTPTAPLVTIVDGGGGL